MSALAVLERAREILDKPEAWTQGSAYRAANGDRCGLRDAARFCSFGAIRKAWAELGTGADDEAAFQALALAIRTPRVADWNDEPGRTHPEVLAAFDGAIEQARAA